MPRKKSATALNKAPQDKKPAKTPMKVPRATETEDENSTDTEYDTQEEYDNGMTWTDEELVNMLFYCSHGFKRTLVSELMAIKCGTVRRTSDQMRHKIGALNEREKKNNRNMFYEGKGTNKTWFPNRTIVFLAQFIHRQRNVLTAAYGIRDVLSLLSNNDEEDAILRKDAKTYYTMAKYMVEVTEGRANQDLEMIQPQLASSRKGSEKSEKSKEAFRPGGMEEIERSLPEATSTTATSSASSRNLEPISGGSTSEKASKSASGHSHRMAPYTSTTGGSLGSSASGNTRPMPPPSRRAFPHITGLPPVRSAGEQPSSNIAEVEQIPPPQQSDSASTGQTEATQNYASPHPSIANVGQSLPTSQVEYNRTGQTAPPQSYKSPYAPVDPADPRNPGTISKPPQTQRPKKEYEYKPKTLPPPSQLAMDLERREADERRRQRGE